MRNVIAAICATLLVGVVQGASARAESASRGIPPFFGRSYQYVVINQDVRGILAEYGRNVGVPVILSDKVQGRVRGEFTRRSGEAGSAGEFLTRLAEANGLTWYFDGSVLYLSADQEFSTQVIEVGSISPDAVTREMRRLGLMDDRFAVRAAGGSGLISASGPPAFIAIVRQVVEKMRPPQAVAGDDPRVRVFRGGQPAEMVQVRGTARSTVREPNEGSSTGAGPEGARTKGGAAAGQGENKQGESGR